MKNLSPTVDTYVLLYVMHVYCISYSNDVEEKDLH